jgi:nicotinate-nucleotide--dimethylbenzimidazole phosphoribosyltransferase
MWRDVCTEIQPLSNEVLEKAWERLDNLTKPRRSLGRLEEIAARVAAIRGLPRPDTGRKEIFVFAGDHGVVEEGVSAYPQEVTGLMVKNFLGGGAAINVLGRWAGAKVNVVDVGMKEEIKDVECLISRNVKRAAANIARGPAMSLQETEQAIEVGIEMTEKAFSEGAGMIATGEMGIGNTTPAAALFAALLPAEPEDVTGKGTGIEGEALSHKIEIVKKALRINEGRLSDPLSILSSLGGLEIAAITGLCLGGAFRRMVVVVDGFISGAGALVAMRLCPAVSHYLFFSHLSQEAGHGVFYRKEGIMPLLDLDMRLGEGTGAALAMQIIEGALRIFNEMATFASVGITPR